MLTFTGRSQQCGDGVSRRDFLRIGALAVGGLTLADVLRLQAQAGSPGAPKSVIMIYLPGGPTHLDTYDLKPGAPAEIRGEFNPIKTNVPGMEFCELMPKQATIADKLTVVRGLVTANEHSAHMVMTGFSDKIKRPAFGSVVSYLRGKGSSLPPYVSMMNNSRSENPEYTGSAHKPFVPSGQGLDNLSLVSGVSTNRLSERKALLASLDNIRRDMDVDGSLKGIDSYNARALDMIASTKARDAFDVSHESKTTRELYGNDNEGFLKARRLVEAGVSVVTLSTGSWDTHGQNFMSMRNQLPRIDRGIYALVTDLQARGMGDDVAVVMWGEFGRTPRINKGAGRDHWPSAGFALLAGGPTAGQVIGESDAHGDRPKGNPVTPSNVLSTLYRHLGIDPALVIHDTSGRPMYLLDERRTLQDLA
jgi:hypothetical protein